MKNTTLLIMAAGIGSRFGGGIKQLNIPAFVSVLSGQKETTESMIDW